MKKKIKKHLIEIMLKSFRRLLNFNKNLLQVKFTGKKKHTEEVFSTLRK